VWELGYKARGVQIENAWGKNTPDSFPVFDRFVAASGIAESIKSIDLDLTSFKTASGVADSVTKSIDSVIDFPDRVTREGFTLTQSQINQKVLRVAIPRMPTEEQMRGMQQAVDYGKLNNITVRFTVY